jgi:KipI family sensor histidine kinase inhibitor
VIPRVGPYGDRALLVEVDDVGSAHLVAAAVDRARRHGQAPDEIEEAVVGFRSVVVHLDGSGDDVVSVEEWLADLVSRQDAGASDATGREGRAGRHVDVPVTFDGPDLGVVAAIVGETPAAVVELACGTDLQVAFLGFAPGFPYLVGLTPELAAVPRRTTPRVSVPAGSVALAGGFATVYPGTTPGGWHLLGRTPVRLFDPDRPPYALLRPGDTVRFTPVPPDADRHRSGQAAPESPPARSPLAARTDRYVEILDPGLLSLVEDGGRRQVAALGIPRAGPADPDSMRLANRLVGNPDGTAVIEVTAVGPTIRFAGRAHAALVAPSPDGQEVLVDGHPVAAGAVVPVEGGQVLTVGRVQGGLRAYLSVSGGFESPVVVGSRSTDLLSGLGPGPLMTGDRLDLGVPTRPHGHLVSAPVPGAPDGPVPVRVVEGPHRLPAVGRRLLTSVPWTVGGASNRIGVRLTGPRRSSAPVESRIPSTGTVTGAIQLPPDGNPIILLPDHATVGGYPVIACVIGADLHLVGQLRPADTVVFVTVDRRRAREEWAHRERMLAGLVAGWFPTEAGT